MNGLLQGYPLSNAQNGGNLRRARSAGVADENRLAGYFAAARTGLFALCVIAGDCILFSPDGLFAGRYGGCASAAVFLVAGCGRLRRVKTGAGDVNRPQRWNAAPERFNFSTIAKSGHVFYAPTLRDRQIVPVDCSQPA